jgi:regulatory GntR family protein
MEMRPHVREDIHWLTGRLLRFGDVLPDDLTRCLRAVWDELEEVAHEEWADSYLSYLSVACAIEGRIARGELVPGEALPVQRELARQFCVGEATVRRAVKKLAGRNLVYRRGSRIIITDAASDLAKTLEPRRSRLGTTCPAALASAPVDRRS